MSYIRALLALLISLCLPGQLFANEPNIQNFLIQTDSQIYDTQVRYITDHLEDASGFIVFVQGSGSTSFSENGVGFDQFVEQILFEQNYAVIYQNKRGVGKTSGNRQRSSIESRAEDVLAVFNYYDEILANGNLPGGVIGHSQGGWVVQILAAKDSPIDFAISLSGSVRTVEQEDLYRTAVNGVCEGLTEKQIAKKVNKRERTLKRMKFIGTFVPFLDNQMMANMLKYQPEPQVSNLKVPMLMAFAGSDSIVSLDDNLERLRDMFPTELPELLKVIVIDDADHLFRLTNTLCFDYFRHGEFAEQLHFELNRWLNELASG